jgi:hypothetical protein
MVFSDKKELVSTEICLPFTKQKLFILKMLKNKIQALLHLEDSLENIK